MRQHSGGSLGDIGLREGHLVVLAVEPLGDRTRALRLVDRASVVADGERLQALRRRLGRGERHERRVDSAAEEHADRHVGDHPRSDRLSEQPLHLRRDRLNRLVALHPPLRRREPAALLTALAVLLPAEHVSGRELAHARHDRAGPRYVGEHEERIDRARVELAQLRLDLQEGGQFRCEQQLAVLLVHEEWLLAEAVARDQQAPTALVPEGEREHALERVHESVAVLLVEVNEHLSVRVRHEAVSA
jgi:hypothetical protein